MHMGSLGSSWRIVWIFVDWFSYVRVDLDSFSWRCNVYKAAMLHHVEFQYCESTSNYKRLGILDGYRWLLAISEPHRGLWDQTFSIKSFEKQPFFWNSIWNPLWLWSWTCNHGTGFTLPTVLQKWIRCFMVFFSSHAPTHCHMPSRFAQRDYRAVSGASGRFKGLVMAVANGTQWLLALQVLEEAWWWPLEAVINWNWRDGMWNLNWGFSTFPQFVWLRTLSRLQDPLNDLEQSYRKSQLFHQRPCQAVDGQMAPIVGQRQLVAAWNTVWTSDQQPGSTPKCLSRLNRCRNIYIEMGFILHGGFNGFSIIESGHSAKDVRAMWWTAPPMFALSCSSFLKSEARLT